MFSSSGSLAVRTKSGAINKLCPHIGSLQVKPMQRSGGGRKANK